MRFNQDFSRIPDFSSNFVVHLLLLNKICHILVSLGGDSASISYRPEIYVMNSYQSYGIQNINQKGQNLSMEM